MDSNLIILSNDFDEKYIFKDDPYAIEYGDDYKKKIMLLHSAITERETGEEQFIVFDFEAGLGKSYKTIQILNSYLSSWLTKQRKFLIVKRFNEDIESMVEQLKHHNSNFQTKVLGITKDNWTSEWLAKAEELEDIQVLIISHQRYKNLCLDDEMREYFTRNRNTLIIDEKVNFPIYTFSKREYDRIRSYLPRLTQDDFDKVCKKLRDTLINLDNQKNECLRIERNLSIKKIDDFVKIIEANLSLIEQPHRNDVRSFIEGLYLWYSTKSIYNSGNISTYNRKHRLWGLENNIILDASASMDGVYKLNDSFNVLTQGRIIDHSKSRFTTVDFNSSKSNLKNDEQLIYPEIANRIKESQRLGDKVLIVCHKSNAEKIRLQLIKAGLTNVGVGDDKEYMEEDIVVNWFGNLIGKNEYGQFNKCWIIGTPNLPYEQYLIHYMQYSMNSLGHKGLKIYAGRFANKTFLKVQEGYIQAEIYQSLKRIQRNIKPEGEFFIVNNDHKIMNAIFKKIKGSEVNSDLLTLDFVLEKERIKEEVKEAKKALVKDKADIFIEYIYGLPKGQCSKKKIKSDLNFDTPHLNRVLTNDKVRNMVGKVINVEYRYVVKI